MLRLVLLAALCSCSVAFADTLPSYPRTVSADVSLPGRPMSRMYNFCVGAGRANEGLRADWQRQLRQVRRECGFRYIRFHGIFCDDMGVYFEDRNGRPIYNWQYVDALYDFLESIGMKPFVELSFMPSALASGSHTIFWYRANVTPPKDYAKWEAFIAAFARHLTERYGRDEVRRWYFEVWNEPNLSAFWYVAGKDGKPVSEALARAEYFRLYAATAKAIKSVDAGYRVGGPATAGNGWIDETLAACAQGKLPLDFVSTHSYATMSGFLDENGNAGTIFSPDRNAITDGVDAVRAKMGRSPFAGAELHYTEWSASYTPFDPIHDSYVSAPFILDKIRNIGDTASSMSYWTFTDIFEEAGPRTAPFHGGFGLLNYEDLPKPAYFAYRFLNRLGGTELKCSDPETLVCRSASGAVQALFWDYTIPRPNPPVNDQVYYVKDHPARPQGRVELRLSGLTKGAWELRATRVGYRANDVQAAWRDLGSPSQLTRTDVGVLRRAASGNPRVDEIIQIGDDGRFARDFAMRENDVWLVQLCPAHE